ncbi:hypothetical protein HX807_06920 [Pseudomonas sp. D8002]|uniref:ParB/Srx family N-terminal domain-containing protein n=1 Tax=Pseudomonas sp. D8002 TaxID=2738816 RepID=UPI0018203C44|nr:ParB/Srx family N-terminal domain-containing protein [Pseudomonas sp. D8002]NWA88332.1 hypothetical protein [Pseudomonas sp. D8002]
MATILNVKLDTSKILMDGENPRHEIFQDQKEIINWHANILGDQLIQLMRSIAKDGLSDIEKILVQPLGNVYVVKEGNRRMAAIKLLRDPSLCDDPLFRKKIENINQPLNFNYKIDCISCDDRHRVLWMMGLRHLGQQNGAGTFKWGAAEKSRHEQDYSGKARYWRSLHFINYALEHKLITDQQAARISEKISNLDRLVPSAEFKRALGVSYKDSSVRTSIEKSVHDQVLGKILERLSEPSFIVSKIYDSAEKSSFITEILDEVANKGSQTPATKEINTSGTEKFPLPQSTNKNTSAPNQKSISVDKLEGLYPKPKPRKLQNPADRDKLFIGSLSIPPAKTKCSTLYRQIDTLKLNEHGLVVACAARALVDISSQIYVEDFKLGESLRKNSFGQIALGDMVKAASANLFKENRIPRELNNLISSGDAANPNSFLHPQALHAFMHGRYENSMTNLKEAWDRCYEEYLRALWTHIKDTQG